MHKNNGIVINKRDLFNGDRELTILMESGLKTKLLIKGIAKSLKREILAADILSLSEFIFTNNIISDISLIENYLVINDLSRMQIAIYFIKLIDLVSYEESPETFELLKKSLENLNNLKIDKKSCFIDFLKDVLDINGILPEELIYSKDVKKFQQILYNYLDVNVDLGDRLNYV